jgi:murein DD-endopeptidase MepM/ murein hydrolase activator NlpD
MSTITVKKGQFIKKGQSVGTVGSSGLSTGAHLHYEVRKNDKLKDPLAYFYTYLTDNLIASNENSN